VTRSGIELMHSCYYIVIISLFIVVAHAASPQEHAVFQLVKPDSTHTKLEIIQEGLDILNKISQKVLNSLFVAL
jgi:hypothetical protein